MVAPLPAGRDGTLTAEIVQAGRPEERAAVETGMDRLCRAFAWPEEREGPRYGKDYSTLPRNRQRLVCTGRLWEGRFVTEIIVAAIALIGTAVGSLGGILAANRLTNYRIEQLEKKVDKHNSVIERITVVEVKLSEQQENLARLRREMKL